MSVSRVAIPVFSALLAARLIYWLAKIFGPWIVEMASSVARARRSIAPLKELRRAAKRRAKPAKGPFDQRFPLLNACLVGQPDQTKAGLKAHFEPVKVNFEFLLGANPTALTRFLAETGERNFVVWTGASGNVPIVYGAGLVRPNAVDEVSQWLSAAGAPGQNLKVAFRDWEGMLHVHEHHFAELMNAGGERGYVPTAP